MFRYIAMVWDSRGQQTQATASAMRARLRAADEWQASIELPGFVVLCAGARSASTGLVMLSRDGVVLGTLFDASGSSRARRTGLDDAESDAIVASCGRRLVDHYWGRYVAFLRSADGSRVWALRDPTGGLPCYCASLQGVQLFFSWAEDARAAGLERCSINWHYLARFVCCGDPQSRATGIGEIEEVHAGERIELQQGAIAARQQLWDAARIARTDPVEDIHAAVLAVRSTTARVVDAWASCHPRVVHLLSGGLDSSILLHCLRSSPARPQITCLNYFGSAAVNEDERRFARLAAAGVDCELVEREQRTHGAKLDRMLECARTAVPLGLLYRVLTQDGELELARRVGASAFFSGVGGDAVFYQGPVALALADHLRTHCGSRGFLGFALAIARMENLSLGAVLGSACKALLPGMRDPFVQSIRERSVVHEDVLRAALHEPEFFWHRWRAVQGRLGPAKLRHLYYMRGTGIYFYSPLYDADLPEYVCPLISQPLMEACLRIPPYVHTAAGWDRAVERRAFSDVIHPDIVLRRSKGVSSGEMNALLQDNLAFVRELMLDGLLVRERLLDGRKVEQALQGDRVRLSPAAAEILGDHLSVEAWLRRWTVD